MSTRTRDPSRSPTPPLELVEIDGRRAIFVSLFVPTYEGPTGSDAGELIYYRILEPDG